MYDIESKCFESDIKITESKHGRSVRLVRRVTTCRRARYVQYTVFLFHGCSHAYCWSISTCGWGHTARIFTFWMPKVFVVSLLFYVTG